MLEDHSHEMLHWYSYLLLEMSVSSETPGQQMQNSDFGAQNFF